MESRGVSNVSTYWVCLLQDPKSDLVDLVSLETQSSRTQECVHSNVVWIPLSVAHVLGEVNDYQLTMTKI